ncbi:MAG: hypothetical protein QOI59_201 [Gammaproteobacteria bacterium]|jgi:hypothetical protein|nr:hypothetical protein [Gammaproteobacteria bacterium]
MALHQTIQRLLLIGVRLESFDSLPPPQPPERLAPLFAAVESEHHKFDQRALHYGHRYRSGFWVIYLLSAIAVLCAVLPLALGWDSPQHAFHPYARVWAICEVVIIGVVIFIYWLGHRRDWQGEWLRARTTAELTSYLPMLAPLLDFNAPDLEANWYVRAFDPGQHLRTADDVSILCARIEPEARALLAGAWSDPAFVSSYMQWTLGTLEQQRRYHCRVAAKQHALLHRVHSINGGLFGLTALGALLHLVVHTIWLSLVTTFFPALGASLHGALAQSEAYRLGATSERLARDLADAISRIQQSMAASGDSLTAVKNSIEGALALILEEHQDWNLLVRPHHLPLA